MMGLLAQSAESGRRLWEKCVDEDAEETGEGRDKEEGSWRGDDAAARSREEEAAAAAAEEEEEEEDRSRGSLWSEQGTPSLPSVRDFGEGEALVRKLIGR